MTGKEGMCAVPGESGEMVGSCGACGCKGGCNKMVATLSALNGKPGCFYLNREVPYAPDVGVEPNCEGLDLAERERAVLAAEMGGILMDAVDIATKDVAGYGLWRSDSLRSLVMMFDPKGAVVPDDCEGDYRRLAVSMRILKEVLEFPAILRDCPLASMSELKGAVEKVIADAERAATEEVERGL